MKTADELLLEQLEEQARAEAHRPVAPAAPPSEPYDDEEPPLPRSRVYVAVICASGALAWMLGGIFDGSLARIAGIGAVVVGVATIALAVRLSVSPGVEYVLLPAAFIAAALSSVVLPNTTGSTGTVPELVGRAIRNGGLLQPPVPFDPGWRFLIVFLMVILAGALTSFALAHRKPMLVPGLPLPLVVAAGLLQAKGNELTSGIVSMALLVVALMVLYTASVAGESGGKRFELKQVARGAGALIGVCVLIAAISRLDVLFPDTHRVIDPRPQKPKVVPLSSVKDRVLFSVLSELPGPWRLGVLDAYDSQDGWLLPPADPERLRAVGNLDALGGLVPTEKTIEATFTIAGLDGLGLPAFASPLKIDAEGVRLDRRTQILRVTGSSPGRGYRYTVHAQAPPSGPEMAQASGVVPTRLQPFTSIPTPPPGIVTLLAAAPSNSWERLQFLRGRLYENVVAAGSGVPIPISPARVVAMLGGADATPYEITAAEAMLARWAGIPARIGYGFYRGERSGVTWEVRPRHGANWLEAWFPTHGWVPVIGTPPRARASLTSQAKNREVITRPSEDLTLQVYIALRQQSPLFLYLVVRYWLAVTAPFVIAAALLWFFLPAMVKPLRGRKRRRWAARRGLQERIAVAYAEFRDAANDMNAGDPYETPLEYLDHIHEDEEHQEFAWLVTRALWGDLQRGLTEEDALEAERMSRSLKRRLTRAQTPLTRLLALSSRASLRGPFDPNVPNLWRASRRRERRLLRRRRIVPATLLAVALVACGKDRIVVQPKLPERLLPATIGSYSVSEEKDAASAFRTSRDSSLVADGKVFTLRESGTVVASLQVTVLKGEYRTTKDEVRRGIRASIETGNYRWFKIAGQWVGEQRLKEIGLYLWYPPGGRTYEVLVVKPELGIPKALLQQIISYQKEDA